ncbi:MAG: hypothetical protein V2J55_04995 [Candidatus Competibacteraceae bacterium]|jgi:hypothetical protein|nr:hypothetical protein [Candidatus Competibacteraceae bacterium]
MQPTFRAVLVIVFFFWSQLTIAVQTDALEPLEWVRSDSALGLTVLKVVIPVAPFQQHTKIAFKPEQWRVIDRNGALRQLYLTATEDESAINLYGLVQATQDSSLEFFFARDWVHFGGPIFTLSLDTRQAPDRPIPLLAEWSEARNLAFAQSVGDELQSQLLILWMQIADKVYGGASSPEPERLTEVAPEELLTAFSLFSGEAAIQETLQQQLLSEVTNPVADGDINTLQGPEIVSHPFETLVQNRSGGTLAIADLVPVDRYLVYISNPGKALTWLDKLAETGHSLIGFQQQSALQWDLIPRYLERLNLSRELVEKLSPLVRQTAFFGPDLYLEQGSHITLLVEAPTSPLLTAFLKKLFNQSSPTGEDPIQPYGSDNTAYFAQHERWLIFSTSRTEAAAAYQLALSEGQGSLGKSAELRYMLSLLPGEEQGLYVYFSDPFIRAMLGPESKIAQLRRQQARARLNLVTAGALLYRLDHGRAATLEELVRHSYVSQGWLQSWEGDRITLDERGLAHSSLYGTLARMTPLIDLSITTVSAGERQAYQQYVSDYSRYWQTYFDPIGVRITVDKQVHIETLILPLVQNSIYNLVRQTIGGQPISMTLPGLSPTPITTLSFKLPQAMLREWVAGTTQHNVQPDWLKSLGGSLHFALYDSDPLLVLGSADLLGAFSGAWLGGGREFWWWGLLGSLLTQPAAVFVELNNNADSAVDDLLLEELIWNWTVQMDFGDSTLEQLGQNGSRGWVYTLSWEDVLRIHLYIRKINQYLVISNRQINFRTTGSEEVLPEANAGIKIAFDNINAMTPLLHLHRMQRESQAVLKNIGRLLPFLLLGEESPTQAIEWHALFYGSRPEHPTGGTWFWQSETQVLTSNTFGTPSVPRVPSFFDPVDERGPASPLDQLQTLDVRFRFEEEGARVQLTLTPRPAVQ